MMNKVILVGRLTKDPELRYTPNGIPQVRVTLAVKRDFKNQQGQYESDFIQVTIWRKQAENTANYMSKGDILGVSGRIATRNYDGQDGKRVYITEIVAEDVSFIHSINRAQGQGGYNGQQGGYNGQQGGYNGQGQNSYNNSQGNYNNQQSGGGGYNSQNNSNRPPQQQNNRQDPFAGQSDDPFASKPNQTRVSDDPFANPTAIEISEDDLPF